MRRASSRRRKTSAGIGTLSGRHSWPTTEIHFVLFDGSLVVFRSAMAGQPRTSRLRTGRSPGIALPQSPFPVRFIADLSCSTPQGGAVGVSALWAPRPWPSGRFRARTVSGGHRCRESPVGAVRRTCPSHCQPGFPRPLHRSGPKPVQAQSLYLPLHRTKQNMIRRNGADGVRGEAAAVREHPRGGKVSVVWRGDHVCRNSVLDACLAPSQFARSVEQRAWIAPGPARSVPPATTIICARMSVEPVIELCRNAADVLDECDRYAAGHPRTGAGQRKPLHRRRAASGFALRSAPG